MKEYTKEIEVIFRNGINRMFPMHMIPHFLKSVPNQVSMHSMKFNPL